MRYLNPEGIYHSARYHSGIRAGNTIYTAGRVPVDLAGKIVAPNNARAQTEKILEDLQLILAEGGARLEDVVMIRTYHLYTEDMATIFEVLMRQWGGKLPPHTGIRVDHDFWVANGTRLEIEVVAMVSGE